MADENNEMQVQKRLRDSRYTPQQRWEMLLQAIDWAEQQQPRKRNDPRERVAEEQRKLRAWAVK